MGTRRITGATVVAAVVLAGSVALAPPASATPVVGSTSVSRTSGLAGEPVTVTVRLPSEVRRPIVLQRSVAGGPWVTVARKQSDVHSDASFTTQVLGSTEQLRGYAPAGHTRRKKYAGRLTPTRSVATVGQTCRLSLPAAAVRGDSVTAQVVFTPARPGRPVTLSGGGTTVRTVENAQGRVSAVLTMGSATTSYVATAAAWGGAAACRSASQTVALTIDSSLAPVRVDLDTDDHQPVTDGEVYSHGSLRVTDGDGNVQTYPTRVRVRGNTTSWARVKLSYKIKLDAKASVLSMPASKDWVLLANFFDRTMLRNALAFEAARRVGMPWVPRMRFADLYLNGSYAGLYQYGEGVTRSPSRVVVPDGGYLLEADAWPDDDPSFRTTRGLQVFLKDPDDGTGLDAVSERMQQIEDLLYSDHYADPVTGYSSVLDVGSFVDWYIVNELTKNVDSGFNNSIWMTLGPDGRLAMAAPWDFDLSLGLIGRWGVDDPSGLYLGRNWSLDPPVGDSVPPTQISDPGGHYLNRLLTDPAFTTLVRARWRQVEARMDSLPAFLDRQADSVAPGAERNFAPVADGGAGMPILGTFIDFAGTRFPSNTWRGDVADLRDLLARRVAWLDTQWG